MKGRDNGGGCPGGGKERKKERERVDNGEGLLGIRTHSFRIIILSNLTCFLDISINTRDLFQCNILQIQDCTRRFY
jgi:hypothetical protein